MFYRDYNEEKVKAACTSLVEQVKAEKSGHTHSKQKYDVFISYCHRNLSTATLLLEAIKETGPELKVFFDYDELKTGKKRQTEQFENNNVSHVQ